MQHSNNHCFIKAGNQCGVKQYSRLFRAEVTWLYVTVLKLLILKKTYLVFLFAHSP